MRGIIRKPSAVEKSLSGERGSLITRPSTRTSSAVRSLTPPSPCALMFELRCVLAQTPAVYLDSARWAQVPVIFVVLSVLAFVRFYFDAGRMWLAWAAAGLRVAATIVTAVSGLAAAAEITGRVVAVTSGDTMTLAVEGGGSVAVRLSDIGAPQQSAFYAPSSRQLLENMVLGKTVRVETSGKGGGKRIVGHVYRGLLDVNLELVTLGAAWFCMEYTNDTSYVPYQSEAIRQQRGLWSRTTTFDALVACRANPPVVKS